VRTCAKAGCPEPPRATAALRYRERVLWIGPLIPARDPNLFDLCQRHADGLTAPYRWERLDERHPPLPAVTAGA
jgi:Protein of unknown function (DUF3499)